MIPLQQNPNYFLVNSQLFPFQSSLAQAEDHPIKLLKIAHEAYQACERADVDQAYAMYSQAIIDYPNYPFFYACRSLLNGFLKDDEGAFYDYQVAKSLDFNYQHYFEWRENEGQMLEADELLELSEQINRQEQPDYQLYVNRSMLLVQHFEYTQAIADLTQAILIENRPEFLISRAAIYMRMLSYDQAYEDLSVAIAASPALANAYYYRGRLFYAVHDFERALQDYNMSISLEATNPLYYEERAQLYDRSGQLDKAILDYSVLIDMQPDDFYAYVLRAELHEKIQNHAAALEDYNKAIQLNPYYSDLYQFRGELKEKIGDVVGAQQDFEKYEELEDE